MFRILARQCLPSARLGARCPPFRLGPLVPSRREPTIPKVTTRRRYTEAEDDLMVRLRNEGQAWAAIAAKLDRATSSVRERGKHLKPRIVKPPSITTEEIYARKQRGEKIEAIARELGRTIWTVNHRLRQAELNGRICAFSSEDLSKIKQLIAEGATISHVARVLGKSLHSVKRQVGNLRIQPQKEKRSAEKGNRKPWPKEEVEEALRMSREGIPKKKIAEALGRSPISISNKLVSLHVARGTRFYKNQRLSPPELRQLVQLRDVDGLSFRQIARHLPHRHQATLCNAYHRLKRNARAAG